jgi:hypothetical protein
MARYVLRAGACVLLCFTAVSAFATDNTSASSNTSADLRMAVDDKREHLTGADAVQKNRTTGEQPILEAPVDTEDAPSVEEQN